MENYRKALGLSSWDEVLSTVYHIYVYNDDVFECIQQRSSDLGEIHFRK